jgi:hypothetical protein
MIKSQKETQGPEYNSVNRNITLYMKGPELKPKIFYLLATKLLDKKNIEGENVIYFIH